MSKKAALIVLDGWGESKEIEGNAIAQANVPNFRRFFEEYPHNYLITSGESVGLPEGQMGNSEVGHLNIGAGRVVYQPLMRIHNEIKDGSFFEKENLVDMYDTVKTSGKKLHFIGLLSDGGVHSHIDHLKALLQKAKDENIHQVYVHAVLDGRDVAPDSGVGFIREIITCMQEIGVGRIATISGRYYAMDRDNRWERIEKAYNAMVYGKGIMEENPVVAVTKSYEEGVFDEFVLPVVVDGQGMIEDGDTVLFYNFRPDRGREMTRALSEDEFFHFPRKEMKLHYYTMTQYDAEFHNLKLIYPTTAVENTIGEYLSKLGKTQYRTAETEKYAHVTFFLNGGREEPFPNETRRMIPSPKVATYDLQPEMSAYEVTDALLEAIESDRFDFFVCNFANADMVGHTGDMAAAMKAVEAVDECLGKLIPTFQSHGVDVIITADHGNADEMIMPDTGKISTQHSVNPVPIIMVSRDVKSIHGGRLCDIAPTLLDLMELPVPDEFTGSTLIKERKNDNI